jgi:ferredoxin
MNSDVQRKITIYFFSGTGNALSVANWIKNVAEKQGADVTLVDIGVLQVRKAVPPDKDEWIGFISPTHGFNFPPVMMHFLFRFPRGKGNKTFIVNTRGGLKFGRVFFPGLSGTAQYLTAITLLIKGYKVAGMRPIDLPSNWISLHPGLNKDAIEAIYIRRKKQAEEFALRLLAGKKDFRALLDLIQDVLITPISFLYYFFGRYMLAKTFIASSKCNTCLQCIEECPVQAIRLVDNRPYWSHKCESCMHCMNLCPRQAIETAHGFITGVFILVNSVILLHIYKIANVSQTVADIIKIPGGSYIIDLFEMLILMLVLFAAYRLVHYLMRFKFFDRLVVYTSLTKLKFWKRYRVKKLKFWKNYNFRKNL